MMMWAKIKTAAVYIAGLVLLTGAGTPVAMNVLADGREHMEASDRVAGNETAEIDKPSVKPEKKGRLVNGLFFEPWVPHRVWIAPVCSMHERLFIGMRITNKRKKEVCLHRYPEIQLTDSKGSVLHFSSGLERMRRKTRRDYVTIKPGETSIIRPMGMGTYRPGTVLAKSGTGHRMQWWDEGGAFHYTAVDAPGEYRVSLVYSSKGRGVYWDERQKKNVEFNICREEVKTRAVSIKIIPGIRGAIEGKVQSAKAASHLGNLGCFVIRSPKRGSSLQKLFEKYGWNKVYKMKGNFPVGEKPPADALSGIDFTAKMILCLFHKGSNLNRFHPATISNDANRLSVSFEQKVYPSGKKHICWYFLAAVVPRSETVHISAAKAAEYINSDPLDQKSRIWTIGPHGGDVADGLQACIEAEKKVIRPGEDIKVKFTLKAADPAQKEPIHVWDGKFSSGYRNHAFLVQMPSGKSKLLRKKVQRIWGKNAPHPVEITSDKPYVLPDWYGRTFKPLKELGLDTGKAGVYTITGIYIETGGPARVIFGHDRKNPPSMWGGNIATNTVQVRVEE